MVRFKPPFVLSVDVGSSSVKAALYDSEARRVPQTEVRVNHRIHATPDGGVEEQPDHLVQNVEQALDEVLASAGDLVSQIVAVGMDTMASTIMGLNSDGEPVTPIYTYADTRSYEDVDRLKEQIDEVAVHGRTGCVQHPSYMPSRFLWLRRINPNVAEQVRLWLDPGTYLYRRWFGDDEVPMSYTIASWTGMLDRRELRWDSELAGLSGLDSSSLPPLADYTQSISGMSEPFASRWPALADVPFFLAVGDGASANVGSGCVSRDSVALTLGTSGAMRVLVPDEAPDIPFGLWGYRLGEGTLIGGALSDGGSVVEWAREVLRLPESDEALDGALNSLEPAGSNITALPFLSGERSPGWRADATASFTGIRGTATAVQILQAMLESMAYRFAGVWDLLGPNLADGVQIVLSGGVTGRSTYIPQLMADVLGTRIVECTEDEATSRGTAILALHAAGVWSSLSDVRPEIGTEFLPDASRTDVYRKSRQAHESLYRRLLTPNI